MINVDKQTEFFRENFPRYYKMNRSKENLIVELTYFFEEK